MNALRRGGRKRSVVEMERQDIARASTQPNDSPYVPSTNRSEESADTVLGNESYVADDLDQTPQPDPSQGKPMRSLRGTSAMQKNIRSAKKVSPYLLGAKCSRSPNLLTYS